MEHSTNVKQGKLIIFGLSSKNQKYKKIQSFLRTELDEDVIAEQESALLSYGDGATINGCAMVVNNLSKRFGRHFMAVKGLSFSVKQGNTINMCMLESKKNSG